MNVSSKYSGSYNATGTDLERQVDDFASKIQGYVEGFQEYVNSRDGARVLGTIGGMSTIACSLILASQSPFVFTISLVAGAVLKSFSPEQVGAIEEAFNSISSELPTGVKALAVVISHVFFPVVFPVSVGLYAGIRVGHLIPPHLLAPTVTREDFIAGLDSDNDKYRL